MCCGLDIKRLQEGHRSCIKDIGPNVACSDLGLLGNDWVIRALMSPEDLFLDALWGHFWEDGALVEEASHLWDTPWKNASCSLLLVLCSSWLPIR